MKFSLPYGPMLTNTKNIRTKKNIFFEKINKRPMGLYALLGHLLVKRMPVMFKLSSTKISEYLTQKQIQGRQKLEKHRMTRN